MNLNIEVFRRRGATVASISMLAVALLLGACSTGSHISDDGKSDVIAFRPAAEARVRGGSYPLTEALRKLKPGMTKDQIAGLLGQPQFNEGFFGVREWDYLVNVTNSEGNPQLVCQLKAVFNGNGAARSFYRKCGGEIEMLRDGKWRKLEQSAAATAEPTEKD